MKVSVVICTYAPDRYDSFTETLESVLAQTHDDVEPIVVVDGTEELYDRIVSEYGSLTVHLNDENLGLLKSRNRGAELADGDVVAFIDNDAVADERWLELLVEAYEEEGAIAAGGRMTPLWIAGEPAFLPEEFYWLVGVTHRGFADGPGEVRNTFGSNISFRRDVFLALGGFDADIGGRKGDENLQGGETELCARMKREYGRGVWYVPEAEVGHKVFDYRTDPRWLLERAFWQGYSKRAMEVLLPESGDEERAFLTSLATEAIPRHLRRVVAHRTLSSTLQFVMLFVFTGLVGAGYLYGHLTW